MSNQIHISNCPVCGAFPTQFVEGGEGGTSYCKFIGGQHWRPIGTIPHEMEVVLAINSNGCQAVINMISATGVGHFIDDDGAHPRLSCITHWMPLPEPPEAA